MRESSVFRRGEFKDSEAQRDHQTVCWSAFHGEVKGFKLAADLLGQRETQTQRQTH